MRFKRGDVVVYIPHGKIGYEPCRGNMGVVLGKHERCTGYDHYTVAWISSVNETRAVAFPREDLLELLGHIDLEEGEKQNANRR